MSENLKGKRCVLTGATGFIGARVLATLLAEKADVTVLVRSRHGAREIEAKGASVIVCDLAGSATVANQIGKADYLFHFAYDIRAGFDANMAAFSGVLDLAKQIGVSRFVHASTVAVYAGWPGQDLDEAAAISRSGRGAYVRAKVAMEEALMASGISTAILQPTIVYGVSGKIWTSIPIANLRAGPVILPNGCGPCPAVHVDDVATAASLAATADFAGCERFLISGSDSLTWREFFQLYADALGEGVIETRPAADLEAALPEEAAVPARKSVAAKVSSVARRLIGHGRFEALLRWKERISPRRGPVWPDRFALDLYRSQGVISIKKARYQLGYEPGKTFAGSVAEIVSKYR